MNNAKNLKSRFTAGTDSLPEFFIKDAAPILVPPLTFIFNLILSTGIFPDCWKKTRITPVYKKGDKENIVNYRPISLLSNFSKILESLLANHFYSELCPCISDRQHGFMKKGSTFTNLLTITQCISENMDQRLQTDVVYTDLRHLTVCLII